MKNLRIVDTKVTSNTVEIFFNQKVTSSITVRNFSLVSETNGTPDVVIESADVRDKVVTLNTKPLTYNSVYKLTAMSIPEIKFLSRDQEYLLLEDGINNIVRIQGPVDIDNPVFSYYKSYFKDNIYDIDNNDSIINKYLKGSSQEIVKLFNETNQVKSDRFLSYFTKDEEKVRGKSAFDRLNNEGAYLVTRVGLNPTSNALSETVEINPFGENVVSLSQQIKNLVTSVQDENFFAIFDKNNLILNLDKNLIKISSLKFTFTNSTPNYEYDLSKLGYQLLVSKYDDNSFTNLSLKSNQARLSDNVLLDSGFDLSNIFRIEMTYYVNDLGKTIDSTTLSVFDIKKSIREEVPPIVTIFDLKHAPVTDITGEIPLLGGLEIFNVESYTNQHEAFASEIKFDLSNLPNRAGQFAVDYKLGKVYVFGSELSTGTGDIPPVISYYYKHLFKSEIDYVFDDQAYNQLSLNDLVALPNGSLIDQKGFVSYNYDHALTPGVDYNANLHLEVLNERVENRYSYPNVFKTLQTPITGAFRVYNETSGEIYEINRFAGNKIYVAGNSSPQVNTIKNEKVNFSDSNETLIVSDSLSYTETVFKIFLKNTNIISKTQAGIGYNGNSSASFSNETIFHKEKFFVKENISSLNIGEYMIDYINGIVYVAVDSLQNYNIGNISYKYGYVFTEQKHLTNIFGITKRLFIGSSSLKDFTFDNLLDQQVEIQNIDNQLTTQVNNTSILNISGLLTVNNTSQLFSDHQINKVMEYSDLVNNSFPINFPYVYSNKTIEIGSFNQGGEYLAENDGYNFYIDTGIKSDFINNNFTYTISAKTKSTNAERFQSFAIVNDQYRVYLTSALLNQIFVLNFTVTADNLTRFVVDFSDGDMFIDYEYLADEIIVSYEYGDNVLDFRESDIQSDTTYYVSYKAGTLREGLNNFASLLRVPELQAFDTEYDRESFRDAVMGGLSSFLLGSTAQAINNLVNSITHTLPEIKETLFEQWILGDSFLHSNQLDINYSSLEKGKFYLGPKFEKTNSLTIPFSSNINLEEGTFSTWFKNGIDVIDNSAMISVSIKGDGTFAPPEYIHIGAQEYHPSASGVFTISKNSIVVGKPQLNKPGIFIFIDTEDGIEKWRLFITNGSITTQQIEIKVTSNHRVYAVNKDSSGPESLTTQQNGFVFKITSQPASDLRLSFIAREEKYIFDTNNQNKNRMSLFFDAFGFLNFRVYDKKGKLASLATSCADWKAEDLHHIAVAWKLNTVNNNDELHLFIDGKEVSNVNYWGENYDAILQGSFRSMHLDRFIGTFDASIIGSNDLETIAGSNVVNSSVNFAVYNIQVGDIIYINEVGFNPGGYSISNVNGQELTTTLPMPFTLTDAKYSVNRASLTLKTKDWLYPNVCVLKAANKFVDFGNTMDDILIIPSNSYLDIEIGDFISVDGYVLQVVLKAPNAVKLSHSVSTNTNIPFYVFKKDLIELKGPESVNPEYYFEDDKLFVTSNVLAGELIFVSTLGINSERNIARYFSWTNNSENIIKTRLPTPINLDTVKIKHIMASNPMNKENVTGYNSLTHSFEFTDNSANIITSISDTGRTLDITISGSNIDFTIPSTYITMYGTDGYGNPQSESIYFTEYGTKSTVNKYTSIDEYSFYSYFVDGYKHNFGSIQISENKDLFTPENSGLYPVLKYSYVIKDGFDLESDGYVLTDENLFFSYSDKDNYIYINDPPAASGIYKIIEIVDNHTIIVDAGPSLVFTGGRYQVLRTTGDKTGFQNGYFTFEQAEQIGQKYFLTQGEYLFDYYSKLNLDYDANDVMVIGNKFDKTKPLNGTLDQIKIDNVMLTDVRAGEVKVTKNITSEFNSLKPLKASESTLFLLQEMKDVAKFYDRNKNKKLFYTNHRINENFGDSIHVLEPFTIDNNGIFNSKEGTISFWISPVNDSFHENRLNTIFDFYGAITEEIETTNRTSLFLSGKASKILKVEILGSDRDYFLNGSISYTLDDTITEESSVSPGQQFVEVSRPVQQVVSVKKTDVFGASDLYGQTGYVDEDRQTIFLQYPADSYGSLTVIYKPLGITSTLNKQVINLGIPLPSDIMKVRVTYLPEGTNGDRMVLYKNPAGSLVYRVEADGKSTEIITPINWVAGSWHKVKLSFSMKNTSTDTITMWVDGYQQHNTFEYDTTYINSPYDEYQSADFGNVVNYNNISKNIKFLDQIRTLTFGSLSDLTSRKEFVMDDLKFTNKYSEGYYFAGERFDLSYSKNLTTVIPSVNDLYTTYLLSGNTPRKLTENFSYLRSKGSVNNDFYLNIFDSFDIVKSNDRVKLILEKLIKLIKPASSRVYIKYLG